ncbi:MAG: hypothetical protein IH792_05565 [Thaumarchaeota archaeon]|nr:hypothetical protein [Nitrososphaerota archaeon]
MRFPKFGDILYQRKGISSIVGGIFFLVLMTSGFTVYYVALNSQAEMLHTQQIIADAEVKKVREDFTISLSVDPSDNDRLAIQVTNKGTNVVEIADAWVVNKTATNQPATKSEIKYDDAFIPAGYSGEILASTPVYLGFGEYDIKVISTLGTIVTEREFNPNNPGFGGEGESTGSIFMEFASFEFCIPSGETPDQDCTSDSSDWVSGWDGKISTEYLWRINLANRGVADIIVEQNTSLFMLHAQNQGGGNLPRVYFIKADSTPTVEDPGAYPNLSKIILKDGTPIMLYFGVEDAGGASLNESHPDTGIIGIYLLTFGYQDVNENGIYDNPGDPPYSQNLAFQALRLI